VVENGEERVDGRKLRYAHRREELLTASAAYVLEHGVADLSMRPLAQSIGVAPSALIHHFGTKEQLVTEVLGLIRDRTMMPRGDDGTSDLETYAAWWYRWDDEAALPVLRLAYEVIGLAVRSPERFADFRSHLIGDWVAVVSAQLRADRCPEDEVDALATSLVAHMSGLQVDLLMTGDHARTGAAHEVFVAMLRVRRAGWHAD